MLSDLRCSELAQTHRTSRLLSASIESFGVSFTLLLKLPILSCLLCLPQLLSCLGLSPLVWLPQLWSQHSQPSEVLSLLPHFLKAAAQLRCGTALPCGISTHMLLGVFRSRVFHFFFFNFNFLVSWRGFCKERAKIQYVHVFSIKKQQQTGVIHKW